MTEPLTSDELQRIKHCEHYSFVKKIMKSYEDYNDYEVGTAVYIKETYNGSIRYVGTGWNNKGIKSKYVIIHKDKGFLFAKRILASGKPSVEVTCLTIGYPSASFELEIDGDLIDAMLLDTIEEYDPTTDAKALAKKKSKASRINTKNRIIFDRETDAYNFLKSLKIGDNIWDANTSFGHMITKYEVIKTEEYKIDKSIKPRYNGYNSGYYQDPHSSHTNKGFDKGFIVELRTVETEYSYNRGDKKLYFYNITNKEDCRSYRYATYYTVKPIKPEDVTL